MSLAVYVGAKPSPKEEANKEPQRNYHEERLRHAARLVKAVHGHDAEGAEDALRAHHAVCADEDEQAEK